MNQSIQNMHWKARFNTFKELKENSKDYRLFSRKVGIIRFVILFLVLFYSFDLIDDFHFALQVIIVFIAMALVDLFFDRVILYPRANLELQQTSALQENHHSDKL